MYTFENVTRNKDGILYMVFYFPQFHFAPENKITYNMNDDVNYTDWDFLKISNRSFTPPIYYNLADDRGSVYDYHDDLAHEYNIGVFIFYHYWADNKMILNLPVDLYMSTKRKTKFMFCWDNQSGYLGKVNYDSPEEHAYQMLRYFMNENYLTDKDGRKPFLIYLTPNFDRNYLEKFINFLSLFHIKLRVGFNWQKHINNWDMPDYSDFASEFGPHMEDGVHSGSLESGYKIRKNNFSDYWQGALSSWDSRPRIFSLRTRQPMCNMDFPNGCVDVNEFRKQIQKIKDNIAENNKDKIITIFAWNEWTEGAVLENSLEFGTRFLECL
jgi:hypothetical protein